MTNDTTSDFYLRERNSQTHHPHRRLRCRSGECCFMFMRSIMSEAQEEDRNWGQNQINSRSRDERDVWKQQ